MAAVNSGPGGRGKIGICRFSEKQEMQRRLTGAGFNTQGVDGIIGPNTIAAIRAFQRTQGLAPDGYASYEILRRLR